MAMAMKMNVRAPRRAMPGTSETLADNARICTHTQPSYKLALAQMFLPKNT